MQYVRQNLSHKEVLAHKGLLTRESPLVDGLLRHLVLWCAVALTGCVTTTNDTMKRDDSRALQTHIQLGLSYLSKKNRDSSRLHFNKALAIDSDAPGAHRGLALLYQLEREWSLAEKHFLRSIKEDRDYSLAYNNYGSFLYARKRYEEAFAAFKTAAEDLGYDGRPYALANLGRTALKLGDKERAEASFEHALSLDPTLTVAMIELADLFFEKEEYSESKKYLDNFAEAAPRQTPRSLWLGIRIERIFGNKDKEASYGLALKNLHPYSHEYLEYQKSLKAQ